jgi:hypothetical protein
MHMAETVKGEDVLELGKRVATVVERRRSAS